MNAFVRSLLLVAAAEAQLLLPLIERPYLIEPPLVGKAFRTDTNEWVIVSRIVRSDWMDYAFDSLVEVRFRLYEEGGRLIAETLMALPLSATWRGHFQWHLTPLIADQWTYLEAFPESVSEKASYTRLYFPGGVVSAYPIYESSWLSPPIQVVDTRGHLHQVMPGDSLWRVFFEPARVDTAWPSLPYVLTEYKPRWSDTPCAWYLRGDSTQVFWTCTLTGAPPRKLNLNPVRQVEALRSFASSKPGDRTDFGLIYAAWGPPDIRIYTTSMETWVYMKQKVSFTFERRQREWLLQRRIEYQAVWK